MKKTLLLLLVLVLSLGMIALALAEALPAALVEEKAAAKPVGVKAVALDGASIQLSWTAGVAGTTYEVQRKSGSKWKTRKIVDGATYTDAGLKKNTKYSYRVRAIETGGKSAFVSVSAKTKNPVTSLKMSKKAASIRVGKSLTLKATVSPKKATDSTLTWTSGNPAVATVSSTGKVTPVAPGSATITATSQNGKTATCSLTVKKRNPTSVSVSPTKTTLYVGETLQLTHKIGPDDADMAYTWSSSKKSVATVSGTGLVTAKKAGTAKITVKTVNGKKATCTVTVKAVSKAPLGDRDLQITIGGRKVKLPVNYAEAKALFPNGTVTIEWPYVNYEVYTQTYGAIFSFDAYDDNLGFVDVIMVGDATKTWRGIKPGDKLSKVKTQYGKPYSSDNLNLRASVLNKSKGLQPKDINKVTTYTYLLPTSRGQYMLMFTAERSNSKVYGIYLCDMARVY